MVLLDGAAPEAGLLQPSTVVVLVGVKLFWHEWQQLGLGDFYAPLVGQVLTVKYSFTYSRS